MSINSRYPELAKAGFDLSNVPESPLPDKSGSGFIVDFGEPESVLNNDPTPYLGTFLHPKLEYYTPPIDKAGLAKTRWANGFHSRMPGFRRDKLLNLFEYQPNTRNMALTRQELGLIVDNLLVSADAYVGITYNSFQQVMDLYCLPSVYMRKMAPGAKGGFAFCLLNKANEIVDKFYEHEVIQLTQKDLLQSIYGIPEYYGAIQSILLNEAATLFRRKYYINGAHLGSLFISTSQSLKPEDEKAIADKIRKSKGVGNWRSMFLHLPAAGGGHNQKASDVFNVVPVGDVATKDEFKIISEMTNRAISAAWGTRPEIAGISPEVVGGTGDIEKLHAMDYEHKTLPLINLVADTLNARLPPRLQLKFKQPKSLMAIMEQK